MIECADNPRDFALIQVLLETGIKLSELLQLTVSDIEFPTTMSTNSYLSILGSRTRKTRLIPLNTTVCNLLTNYLKGKNLKLHAKLFTNKFGEGLSARGSEKIVRKYLHRVGIRDASIQSLRHTFAIRSLVSGVDLKTLQDIMGYNNNHTIAVYLALVKQSKSFLQLS